MPVFTAWWMGSPIWIATITLKTSNRPSRSIMSCFEPYFLGTYIIHISQCSFAAIHISAGDFFSMGDYGRHHFHPFSHGRIHLFPWPPVETGAQQQSQRPSPQQIPSRRGGSSKAQKCSEAHLGDFSDNPVRIEPSSK